jgi:hypothetical protein
MKLIFIVALEENNKKKKENRPEIISGTVALLTFFVLGSNHRPELTTCGSALHTRKYDSIRAVDVRVSI